jgi:DNA-binding PadR family transcriptional regulator
MQKELEIMSQVASLLEPLDAAARARVLGWAISALDVQGMAKTGGGLAGGRSGQFVSSDAQGAFSTFAELFHAAGPTSEKEKALVAAYWVQQSSGAGSFAAQQLNTELKHIGYGVANITDALNQLISDRPNFVIQLAKSGISKQARKTYKITDAGLRRVSEMLGGESEDIYLPAAVVTAAPTKAPSKNGDSATAQKGTAKINRDLNLRPTGKQSFAEFIADKQPSSNQDKFAVAVYYLEQILELPAVALSQVRTVFRLTENWREPANIDTALRVTAVRKATIDTSDMDNIRTTAQGRNFVEHDLPPKSGK